MANLNRGILNDLQYTDGRATWRLTHRSAVTPNFSTGAASITDVTTDIDNCVKRSPADRQLQSTRQIQQRLESLQADVLNMVDLVLEVPGGHTIAEGDTIQELDDDGDPTGSIYMIVSNDIVDFTSRNRLGCRHFK